MKGLKGILKVLIVAPLLVWGLNLIFFPKNNGKEYTDEYINNSIKIELDVLKVAENTLRNLNQKLYIQEF